MKNFFVATLAVCAIACATAAPQRPPMVATGAYAADHRDDVWGRAVSTLQRRGYVLAATDRATGVLATQPLSTGQRRCYLLWCATRETVQVAVPASGPVAVTVAREFLVDTYGGKEWRPPVSESDVADVEQLQGEILAEILGDAAQATTK